MTIKVAKMDELEFRRTIYADPNCNDGNVNQAAGEDPAKLDFWNELKKLDNKIQQASQVKVPDDLAHKLILRQSMETHRKGKQRNRIHLALAASIAFVFGISFTMWQQQSHISLGEHALAHVYHEGAYALEAQEDISLQQINAKLARFGGELSEDIGQIFYANFCDFENIQSLHLVMQGEQGRVSVFVIPHSDKYSSDRNFSDGKLKGDSVDFSLVSLMIVGEQGQDVEQLKDKLKQKLQFSA
jgi:hypothetical protein